MQQGGIEGGRGALEPSLPPQNTPLPLALTVAAFQEGQLSMRFNYGAVGGLFDLLFVLCQIK